MKHILIFILVLNFFSINAQDFNSASYDNSKDKVYAIDHNFDFFKTELNEDNIKLTGFYNYDLFKVIEETSTNKRTYYYWMGKLFSVHDKNMNKQFFFKGDYKNAAEKLSDFYSNKADEYKSKFDSYFINPIFKVSQIDKLNKKSTDNFYQDFEGRYDHNKFNTYRCLIIETNNYSIKSYHVKYMKGGKEMEYKSENCTITEDLKDILKSNHSAYLTIKLNDKQKGIILKLPTVKFKY